MRKKLISGLALTVFLLGIGQMDNVYADEHGVEIVDGLIVDEETAVPLYNNEEDVAAYYLEGEDKGYIIIDNECNVVEFSYQDSIEEIEESDTDCYYGGPGNYYTETNSNSDVLIDISSDEKIEKDDIESFETNESQDVRNIPGKKSATITLPDGIKYSDGKREYTSRLCNKLTLKSKGNLPYHSRYFNYNDKGTCGSTAAAIFTYYYYDHIAKSYIKDNKYKKGNKKSQEALVDKYKKLIGDNGSGTRCREVANGINKYLKSIGKKESCTYITKYNILQSVMAKIEDRIKHKRPCIVGLAGEPKYGDHWVVGIGYAQYCGYNGRTLIRENFVKVNDGWGESRSASVVYVNYKYVDSVIYLTK